MVPLLHPLVFTFPTTLRIFGDLGSHSAYQSSRTVTLLALPSLVISTAHPDQEEWKQGVVTQSAGRVRTRTYSSPWGPERVKPLFSEPCRLSYRLSETATSQRLCNGRMIASSCGMLSGHFHYSYKQSRLLLSAHALSVTWVKWLAIGH